MSESKELLEATIKGLEEKCAQTSKDLDAKRKELEDLGKPEATPEFLDKINETITEAVESIDLEDGISCDFEIDYDNKIAISEARFDDTNAVADKIYCAVEKLFAEIKTNNSQLNIRRFEW